MYIYVHEHARRVATKAQLEWRRVYLQTMANRGYNPLVAIQKALADDFE